MSNGFYCLFFVLCLGISHVASQTFVLHTFAGGSVASWTTNALRIYSGVATPDRQSNTTGLWNSTVTFPSIRRSNLPTNNFSPYTHFRFSAYNLGLMTQSKIVLMLDSENGGSTGLDYYSYAINVDWETNTWKTFQLPFDKFQVVRSPVGWQQINSFSFSSNFAGEIPNPNTRLLFDKFEVVSLTVLPSIDVVQLSVPRSNNLTTTFFISNQRNTSVSVRLQVSVDVPVNGLQARFVDNSQISVAATSRFQDIALQFDATRFSGAVPSASSIFIVRAMDATQSVLLFTIVYRIQVVPITNVPLQKPGILFTASEARAKLDRLLQNSNTASLVANHIQRANTFRSDPSLLQIPQEYGRWNLYFVCSDKSGAFLRFDPKVSTQFFCPSTSTFESSPEQRGAWVTYKNNYNIDAMWSLSIAYLRDPVRNASFAVTVANMLEEYADLYNTFEYHDPDLATGITAARKRRL